MLPIIIYVVLLTLMLVIIIYTLYGMYKLQSKDYFNHRRFKKVFGYKPERSQPLSNLQKKAIVIPTIKQLASSLHDCYSKETDILNQISEGEGKYEDLVSKYLIIESDKEKNEKLFFGAIKTANECGFTVPESFREYLSINDK